MRHIRGIIALILAVTLGGIASVVVLRNLSKSVAAPPPVHATTTAKAPPSYTRKIPPGLRAISVQVTATSGLSKKLKYGDIVDVIVTSSDPGEKFAHLSRVVLQRVRILSAYPETETTTKARTFTKAWNVSLIVTPEQGVALSSAAASGEISLLAVNPEDDQPVTRYNAGYSLHSGVHLLSPPADLSAEIPEGLRAITLTVKKDDGICSVFEHGDRVDLIGTSKIGGFTGDTDNPGSEGMTTAFHHSSKTLLQNIEVLNSEKVLDNLPSPGQSTQRVTLLVKPHEAEMIAAVSDASKKTVFRLISRNRSDTTRTDTQGAYVIDMLAHKKEVHRVTIYRKTKSSNKIFYTHD
ncbi:Flp pilus assembly protein CpaB [Desulfoluna spongiiphila]|uniref:Flp pilus assembly protein CpaB n=1 Tax=Desulfoluna spongiiphila TaxID=419481 RepID=A0A1G5HDG0_9BACT|nr:Flp pilus assembly protein CpaB [Desulfoluna spongiiphila]SCY61885.1 Flp pilus assembly protein CpaB [Desulfoluna spongiiphila]VVS94652.1 pilus assembly flp-type cpab [Desulfoluna spongiiphila]